MLIVKSNEEVQQERQEDSEKRAELARDPFEASFGGPEAELANKVRSCWEEAKSYRRNYSNRFKDCLLRRKGQYSDEKLAKIKAARSSTIFIRLTSSKCKAAKTWLADLFEPAGDKPFSLKPRNYPDLSPDIAQQMIREANAAIANSQMTPEQAAPLLKQHQNRLESELRRTADKMAEKMEARIEDMLHEAGWKEEFDDFLDDAVTYPTAILAGLEFRTTNELRWVPDGQGKYKPEYAEKITSRVRRVSPFKFYPSPSVTTTLKGHWCIEHITYPRSELVSMRKTPGFNAPGIAKALMQYQHTGHHEWMWEDDERRLLNEDYYTNTQNTIDALRWSGMLDGSLLNEMGVSEADPNETYQSTVEIIGNYVIRAVISPDPDATPDYYHASFSSVPGSFYGDALPELMSDCQDMCNAAARAVADNMQFASGPMVWVNTSMMAPGAKFDHISPRKIFKGASEQDTNVNAAIQFFQPQSNAGELISIFEKFSALADEVTGLPKFAYGSDQGAGAAKTASGLSMLMNSASKTIKHVVRSIDINVIEKIIKKAYDHEMMYGEDESIKGDLTIKAKGSQALIHKESIAMQQRDLLATTANPVDMQILGLSGRAGMLKNVLSAAEVPVDDFPDATELQQRMQAAQNQTPDQQAAVQ